MLPAPAMCSLQHSCNQQHAALQGPILDAQCYKPAQPKSIASRLGPIMVSLPQISHIETQHLPDTIAQQLRRSASGFASL